MQFTVSQVCLKYPSNLTAVGGPSRILGVVGVIILAATAGPQLRPIVLWVPDNYHSGGAYTAIQAGPDGRVYLGTTFYDNFARFLVLLPDSHRFQLLADMATATGEAIPGPYAQAKIHTKPVVAPDGKVYFGTKSGKPAKDARWQSNYPGGHLLVYDPQGERVTDLGIPRPQQSIIAVGLDPRRTLVYALTDPEGHLITYDPRTRTFSDRGVFAQESSVTRYLIVLANGDAFHPAGTRAFVRYRAATGQIERLELQFSGRGRYEPPYALAPAPDGIRFYGVGEDSGEVYSFIPGDRDMNALFHGAILPAGYGLPGSHYTMTSAPDGNIYYTAALQSRMVQERHLFIMRLLARTGRLEIVGQVPSLPAVPTERPAGAHVRKPAKRIIVQGSTAGPDGTLYVMTAYPLRVLVFPKLASPP